MAGIRARLSQGVGVLNRFVTARPSSNSSAGRMAVSSVVRGRAPGVAAVTSAALVCIAAGMTVAASHGTLAQFRIYALALVAVAVVAAAALALSPNAVLAASFLAFAAEQVSKDHPLHAGPITVYGVDVVFALLVVRTALPRPRAVQQHGFRIGAKLAFGAYLAVMALAALHGLAMHVAPNSVLRLFAPTLYLFGFYRAFSGVVREEGFRTQRLIRDLVVIALGLVVFMVAMRAAHHPFENQNAVGPDGRPIGHLGRVISANGTVFHRDYGLASAYIIYPMVALLALGVLTGGPARARRRWSLLLTIAILATVVTLIRGEIYGLVIGCAAILVASGAVRPGASMISRRLGVLLTATLAVCIAVVAIELLSPGYASEMVQRAVPFAHQSQAANTTASYRVRAISGGVAAANARPLGHGFVTDAQLAASGIDPGYLAHSSVAFMLIYVGWPGLIAAALATFALLRESFRAESSPPWAGRTVGGIAIMLAVASFGGIGVFGEPEAAGLAALLFALRFAAVDPPPYEAEPGKVASSL